MIEFGVQSPVHVVCDGGECVLLENLIDKTDRELLTMLFTGQQYLTCYRDHFTRLDLYLDIPYVEAYFNRESYGAFHRLVINKCTKFPNYDLDKQTFCKEAAKQNHLETLKRAYEMGMFWGDTVFIWGIKHQNLEMIEYVIEQGGPIEFKWYTVIKTNNVHLVQKLFALYPIDEFPPECWKKATMNHNMVMLEFMKSHTETMTLQWWDEEHQSRMHIGHFITSIDMLEFLEMNSPIITVIVYEPMLSNIMITNCCKD